ncbi:MAG: hypothetical protein DMF62_03660 [Acidobacteria bacterium]|nr:MAG: hypothetical protein DMF62_03660 [Acidobacteriota bacterium]
MPMTVAEFYDDLRTVIARGTAVDTSIPIWSRSALRFLEREITFDYMKVSFFLLQEPGSKFFDFGAEDPPIPLKRIEALGYFGQDGGMIPLSRINVNSIGRNISVIPNGYRQAGTRIFFEGAVSPPGITETTTAYPLMLHTSLFTEWPTVGSQTHPILDIADDLIKHQVLLQSVTSVRKQEEMAGWKLLRDEAIGSVRRLQDENELEGSQAAQMDYWGGTTGRLFPNVSAAIAAIKGMYDVPNSFGVAGLYMVGGSAAGLAVGSGS